MTRKVGVVGAGTMGQGIANAFASAGNDVTVVDVKKEWAENGVNKIFAGKDKLLAKGKITQEAADAAKANLKAGEYEDLADCDLIVEAVLEQMPVKKDLFKKLDEIVKEDAIFGTNTSSLSVTEIANGIKHPGANTPDEVKETIKEISKEIGKTPVEVNEGPGFVVNRILIPMVNEASVILQEGIASTEDIDTAMQLGANHPMGPLALGDLIGLDVVLAIMDVLYHETGDSKYRASTLLRKMVRAGKLGRKTGEGFYNYKK